MMKGRVTPSFATIGQSQPGSGKGKALLAVDSEFELVGKLVSATVNRTTICGDAATRAGALEALEENTWVHLACHGKQDPTQPYDSHFVMRDGPLTLLDIMEKDIPHAEFAFLYACHTMAVQTQLNKITCTHNFHAHTAESRAHTQKKIAHNAHTIKKLDKEDNVV
jgi:CHAT domain-containing protein